MTEVWYSYREIRFTRYQVLWILEYAALLREGRWPVDPIPSGYLDLPIIRKKGGKEGYFIKPVETIAEIEARLERCGTDGLILEAMESWGKTEESLANYFKMPVWSIRKRARRALAYVASGPARRWHTTKKRSGETYQQFKKRKK